VRGFKRKINPIFVEEDYDWGKKRRGKRVLLWLAVIVVIAGLALVYLANPA